MSSGLVPRIEINGRAIPLEQLGFSPLPGYGHFTAMQVRDGRTRGLDLHLARLEAGTRELFSAGLDVDRVRDLLRRALGKDDKAATARIYVFWDDPADETASVMVKVNEPATMSTTAQRLRSVQYLRPVAQVKHVGGFAQVYHGLLAERDGFDDALLTGEDGVVAETTIANIGFLDGSTVVWPDAPALHGITMLLLEQRLAEYGLESRQGSVHLDDLPSFRGAFVANSLGIAPVGRIDDHLLPADPDLITTLNRAYESVPWQEI